MLLYVKRTDFKEKRRKTMSTKAVSLYLQPELVAIIDQERGNYSRNKYIEHELIERFMKN